jgi:hypothetical protein
VSWDTDKTTITDALPSAYSLIPENKEPDEEAPETFKDKGYSIRLTGFPDFALQSGEILQYSHGVMLRVIYRHVDDTQLTANEVLIATLLQTISNIDGFHSFVAEPDIDRIDNKHIVFNLHFHFGYDDNE